MNSGLCVLVMFLGNNESRLFCTINYSVVSRIESALSLAKLFVYKVCVRAFSINKIDSLGCPGTANNKSGNFTKIPFTFILHRTLPPTGSYLINFDCPKFNASRKFIHLAHLSAGPIRTISTP